MLTTISFEKYKNTLYKTLIDNNNFKELIILKNSKIYLEPKRDKYNAIIKINQDGLYYLNSANEFIVKLKQLIIGKISNTTTICDVYYCNETLNKIKTNYNYNKTNELIELLMIERDLIVSKELFIGNTSLEKAFTRLNIITNDKLHDIKIKHPFVFNKIGAIRKWYYKYNKLNLNFDTYIYNAYDEVIKKIKKKLNALI